MPEVNFNLLAPSAELYSGPQVKMDPVAAYEKAKATRQSNMLAQLYAKHYDPQTGGVNYNALIPEAAQSGLDVSQLMPSVREQQESMASIAQKDALRRQEEAAAAKYQQEIDQAKMKQLATESYGRFRSVKNADDLLAWHLANPELPGTNKAERTARLQAQLAQPGGYEAARSEIEAALQDITGIKPAETKQFQPTAFESEFAQYKQDPAAYRRFKEAQKVETGSGAKATETVDDTGITKAERNKREAAYPKAKLSFTNASSDIDTLISDLNTLKSHKGLSGITGLVYGRTPGITGDARAAEALLEKILSRGQFRSLQELRNNSPTGGAVGNVSDFEGRALRSSFGALDRKQDTPDFQNAIDDVIDQLKSSKQNLTGAFEDTYSYRSGGAPSAPAAGTPQTPTARTVVRTGTANGKKVVQYSDGSVEYAP